MKHCLLILFLASFISFAQNGAINTDFGSNGELIIDVDELDECSGIITDHEGNLLFYGHTAPWDGSAFLFDIVIGKLTPTGELDTNFADQGIYRSNFPGFTICNLVDIEADSSGIYFLGSGVNPMVTDTNEVFLGKLNLNGELDTTFAIDGFYSPGLLSNYNTAGALIIDSQDRLVIGGSTTNPAGALEYPYVGRVFKSGLADSTFGNTGFIAWDYFTDTILDVSSMVPNYERHGEGGYLTELIEVNNSYFAVGHALSSFNAEAMTMMLNYDGSFNTNYNGTGHLLFEPEAGYNFFTYSLIKRDDKLYLTMETNGFIHQDHFFVQPVDTNGILDAYWFYDYSGLAGTSKVMVEDQGSFFLGGYMKDQSSTSPGYDSDRFFLTELDYSGVAEPSFGASGVFSHDMGTGDELGLEDAAVTEGQLVMAGYVNNIVTGNYVDFAFMSIIHGEILDLKEEVNELSVYPNPTNGKVKVGSVNTVRFEVYSLQGKWIGNGESEFDLTSYPSGIYVLKGIQNGTPWVKKIVRL